MPLGHQPNLNELRKLSPEDLIVGRPAEKVAQRLGERGCVGSQHILELLGFLVHREVEVGLADQRAAIVDHASPQRSGLIPSGVGGVYAEDQEKGERGHADGKWQRWQRNRLECTERP
eukprot:scaffold229956_cov36-Tisochrysis_lutea.AAC.2